MKMWLCALLVLGGCNRTNPPKDGGPAVVDAAHERGARDATRGDLDGGDDGRVDIGERLDGPNNCSAERSATGIVQVLGTYKASSSSVFTTKSGGTIIVVNDEIVLFDGGKKTTQTVPWLRPRPTFADDRLAVVDAAGNVSVFDAQLALVQTLPYSYCQTSMFLFDRDHLACWDDGVQAKWRVYDLTTKQVVLTIAAPSWLVHDTLVLRRMGSNYLVGATASQYGVVSVGADWKVEVLCREGKDALSRTFIVDAAAGEIILGSGKILKVLGTTCPYNDGDYFQPAGALGFMKTEHPNRENLLADDDGTDFAAVVYSAGGDCETEPCRLIKAQIQSRKLLRSAALPPMQLKEKVAYSPACGYLAATRTAPASGAIELVRLWLP